MRTLCSLIITLLLYVGVDAQNHEYRLNFFQLSRTNGLSDNNVTAIVKDHDGYIWFGTTNGLNRYNGYDFKIQPHYLEIK